MDLNPENNNENEDLIIMITDLRKMKAGSKGLSEALNKIFNSETIEDLIKVRTASLFFRERPAYLWGYENLGGRLLERLIQVVPLTTEMLTPALSNTHFKTSHVKLFLSMKNWGDLDSIFTLLTKQQDDIFPLSLIINQWQDLNKGVQSWGRPAPTNAGERLFLLKLAKNRLNLHSIPDSWVIEILDTP